MVAGRGEEAGRRCECGESVEAMETIAILSLFAVVGLGTWLFIPLTFILPILGIRWWRSPRPMRLRSKVTAAVLLLFWLVGLPSYVSMLLLGFNLKVTVQGP